MEFIGLEFMVFPYMTPIVLVLRVWELMGFRV